MILLVVISKIKLIKYVHLLCYKINDDWLLIIIIIKYIRFAYTRNNNRSWLLKYYSAILLGMFFLHQPRYVYIIV